MVAGCGYEVLSAEVDEALRGDAALSASQVDDVQRLREEAEQLIQAGRREDAERVLQQAIVIIKTRMSGLE